LGYARPPSRQTPGNPLQTKPGRTPLIFRGKLFRQPAQALYLTDVLERVVSGRTTINRLDELLPWTWKAARQDAELKAAA
jgi:hypothetical protein